MKKVNATEMRNVEGGVTCKKCKAWYPFKWMAGYHILFNPGHTF